jgi:predicted transcriptional regulator
MSDEKTILRMKRDQLIDLIQSTISEINQINDVITTINLSKENAEKSTQEIVSEGGLLEKIRTASQEVQEKLAKIKESYDTIVGNEEDGENNSIKRELE